MFPKELRTESSTNVRKLLTPESKARAINITCMIRSAEKLSRKRQHSIIVVPGLEQSDQHFPDGQYSVELISIFELFLQEQESSPLWAHVKVATCPNARHGDQESRDQARFLLTS